MKSFDPAAWSRAALAHSGLRQRELARRLGNATGMPWPAQKLNKIITGSRTMTADELVAIAALTNFRVLAGDVRLRVPGAVGVSPTG